MAILSVADFDSIRKIIDLDLAANDLPDTVINQDVFLGSAEREVIARYPDAESETGDDLLRIKAAAIYLTAARIAPTVVRKTSINIQTRDSSYSKPAFDGQKRAQELRSLADTELNEVIQPSATAPTRPTMFAVASGTRGK